MTSLGRVKDRAILSRRSRYLFEARPIRRFPPVSFHTLAEAWDQRDRFFFSNAELGISRCLYPKLSPPFKSTDLPGKQQSPSVCVFEYFSAHILSELSSIIDFPFLTINVSIPNRKLITLLLNGIWMRHAYVSRASALQNMLGSGSYTSQTLQNSANNMNNSIFLTFKHFTPAHVIPFFHIFPIPTSKKMACFFPQTSTQKAQRPESTTPWVARTPTWGTFQETI